MKINWASLGRALGIVIPVVLLFILAWYVLLLAGCTRDIVRR